MFGINEEDEYFWETEFFALSVVTGEMQRFLGTFVVSKTLQGAMNKLREDNNFPFLQLTGEKFSSIEEAIQSKYGADTVSRDYPTPTEDEALDAIIELSMDDLFDILDTKTKEEIQRIISMYPNNPEISDKLQMIEGFYKNKYGNKKKEEDGEEDSTSEEDND